MTAGALSWRFCRMFRTGNAAGSCEGAAGSGAFTALRTRLILIAAACSPIRHRIHASRPDGVQRPAGDADRPDGCADLDQLVVIPPMAMLLHDDVTGRLDAGRGLYVKPAVTA